MDELSARCPRFAALWAGHGVVSLVDRPPVRFARPLAGELTLTRDNLAVDGPAELRLMIYHAEPGTDSAAALGLLTDLAHRH